MPIPAGFHQARPAISFRNLEGIEIYLHSIGEAEREAMEVFEAECENKKSHTKSHTEKK